MTRRLFSLIRKEFIQIVRDPRTLAITFIMPVVMLFLLGYAATNDVRNIALAVFDQDQSPASRRLLEAYKQADYFKLAYVVSSEEEMRDLLDNNSARAGIIIPPGYGSKINGWRSAEVAFVLDGSDPTTASTALAAAIMIGQTQSTKLQVERLEKRGLSNVMEPPDRCAHAGVVQPWPGERQFYGAGHDRHDSPVSGHDAHGHLDRARA